MLSDLAAEYAVKLAPTNGQAGGFLHTDIAPVLQPADRVLYIGDFDWCGHQIENNTRSVLERLVGGDLNWTRIALTAEQVEQYNLADKQILKADHRYKPVRHYPAVETEALKQHVVVQIIRDALDAELPAPLDRVREREARERERLAACSGRGRDAAAHPSIPDHRGADASANARAASRFRDAQLGRS